MAKRNFQDELHAYHTGMLFGALVRAGIVVRQVRDPENNCTDEMEILINGEPDDPDEEPIEVLIKVLP